MSILVTGGAGFIGSNFVLDWFYLNNEVVVNLDQLTYAGSLHNLAFLRNNARHIFFHGNIDDSALVSKFQNQHSVHAVVNFTAESHVDRSIYYAIDARKIERELGWKPAEIFETGTRKTVRWCLDNPEWVTNVQFGSYRQWAEKNYMERAL